MAEKESYTIEPDTISNTMELQIRCHNIPWARKTGFCVFGKTVDSTENRKYAIVTNLEMQTINEGEELRPTFSFRNDQVQALMDELYRIGFRPTEQGTKGELEAVKFHLNDMRELVGKIIDVPKLRSEFKK